MTQLSVILPWVDTFEAVERTLVSVLENRPARCEIILAHRGPYDDPYELAGEVRFAEGSENASLVELVNHAANSSVGEVLCVLTDGVVAQANCFEQALACFSQQQVASVAPLVFSDYEAKRLLTAGLRYGAGGTRKNVLQGRRVRAGLSKAPRIDGPSATAAFYRRDLFLDCEGYSEATGTRLADIDFAMLQRECNLQSEVAVESHFEAAPAEKNDLGFSGGARS